MTLGCWAMPATLILADAATRDDLRTMLQRLERSGRPEVRLVTRGSALAVYGCTQAPRGITDGLPVVLVMRAFALADETREPIDATVQTRALLDRLARLGFAGRELELPDVPAMAAWSGVLPPVEGWRPLGTISAESLGAVAAEGIARVAAALPEQPGEAVVHRVRSEVWGAEIAPGVPAAAAFAAEALGFLGEEPLRMAGSLTWTRLTSERGHVLVRQASGRIAIPAGLG
ncbi:hypothetical protein GCM10027033_15510 [Leucobacter ruminantium]